MVSLKLENDVDAVNNARKPQNVKWRIFYSEQLLLCSHPLKHRTLKHLKPQNINGAEITLLPHNNDVLC